MVRVKCRRCGEVFSRQETLDKHLASVAHQEAIKSSLSKEKASIPSKSNPAAPSTSTSNSNPIGNNVEDLSGGGGGVKRKLVHSAIVEPVKNLRTGNLQESQPTTPPVSTVLNRNGLGQLPTGVAGTHQIGKVTSFPTFAPLPFPIGSSLTTSSPSSGWPDPSMGQNATIGSTHHSGAGATLPMLPQNPGQRKPIPDFHRYPVLLYKRPPRVAPFRPAPPKRYTPAPDQFIRPQTRPASSRIIPPPPVEAAPPRPPQWEEQYEETIRSQSIYKTFPVGAASTPEFQTIAEMICPFEIVSAERVVNPALWQRYQFTRTEMLRLKSEDLGLLRKLGLAEEQVKRRGYQSQHFVKDPRLTSAKYSPNEVLLFHCTRSEESLQSILGQGLDERLCSTMGGRLGKGIYFADDPLKSFQFKGVNVAGEGIMLIFSVLLGDTLFLPEGKTRMLVREPEKDSSQRRNPMDLFFDGVTTHESGCNEYVIYNRGQCYPMYFIRCKLNLSPFAIDQDYFSARRNLPTIAWNPMPNNSVDGGWPFFAASLFKKMGAPAPPNADPVDSDEEDEGDAPPHSAPVMEECTICFNEYLSIGHSPQLWKLLNCGHKLCHGCYSNIQVVGFTMQGISHTSVKCPFCQNLTGKVVGSCPDGSMAFRKLPMSCAGYPDNGSIQIKYAMNHEGRRYIRIAYLPDNPMGEQVFNLLKKAWDFRLIFAIGTSNTTGAQNVPVWNIHHKTSLDGGVQSHGYPDPTYLDRVKGELKAFGIE